MKKITKMIIKTHKKNKNSNIKMIPNKNQRFSEEELKIIQEFYKRAPSLPSPPSFNYYIAPPSIPS